MMKSERKAHAPPLGSLRCPSVICLLGVAACMIFGGCPRRDPEGPVSIVFKVADGGSLSTLSFCQLELHAYGRMFGRTGRLFKLKDVASTAELISYRKEPDGSTTFLVNGTEPIVFVHDKQPVKVFFLGGTAAERVGVWTISVAPPSPRPPETGTGPYSKGG